MDPLCHTLVGAGLAETRLGKTTPLATVTLLVGANLPDVDVLSYFGGSDFALAHRRGWTHGLLAVAVLPLMLAGLMLVYDRWIRRRRRMETPAIPARILFLAYLATASHPALDWLNTYGMRWLMPFDGRWSYGDALFIVDPWIWLALGGVLFLAHSRSRRSQLGWALLAALLSLPVLVVVPAELLPAKLVWCLGLVAVVLLRARQGRLPAGRRERRADSILLALLAYIGVALTGTWTARGVVLAELQRQGISNVSRLMVGPVPVNPLAREVVAETSDVYHYGRFDWLSRPRLRLAPETIPVPEHSAIAAAALGAPCIQGTVAWMRFPWIEIEDRDPGYEVYVMDARYTRRRTEGFGATSVRLDQDLQPIAE